MIRTLTDKDEWLNKGVYGYEFADFMFTYKGIDIGVPFNLKRSIECLTRYSIPNVAGLYHLFNDTELVYIGKANNIRKRLIQHLTEGKKDFINVLWFCMKDLSSDKKNYHEISQWEIRLIKELKPKYNVIYNSTKQQYD